VKVRSQTKTILYRGFSLIEVMIAMLILSVGLLGVAALQIQALALSTDSAYQHDASILASSMIERTLLNTSALTGINGNLYVNLFDETNLAATESCYTSSGCTSSQMAQNDILEWRNELQRALPEASATLCFDSSPTTTDCGLNTQTSLPLVIKIWWVEKSGSLAINKSHIVVIENIGEV
jgi:type IV pilus assembly protein PilV